MSVTEDLQCFWWIVKIDHLAPMFGVIHGFQSLTVVYMFGLARGFIHIYVRQQYGEDASHRGCQDPPILSCSAWVRSWICQAIVRLNHSDLMICYNVDCGEGSRKVGMARHVTHELETLGCRKTICFAVWYCNAWGLVCVVIQAKDTFVLWYGFVWRGVRFVW